MSPGLDAATVQPPLETSTVEQMTIPIDLRYTSDHEWVVRRSEDVVRIGITDYAQDALGDVVYVQVPEVGAKVAMGQSFGEVESTKSVSEVFAPLAGEVVAVNESLNDSPALLNEDPYGDGWICEIRLSDPGAIDDLLDAAAYGQLIEG
jgi:glycine cleavage system H protein